MSVLPKNTLASRLGEPGIEPRPSQSTLPPEPQPLPVTARRNQQFHMYFPQMTVQVQEVRVIYFPACLLPLKLFRKGKKI